MTGTARRLYPVPEPSFADAFDLSFRSLHTVCAPVDPKPCCSLPTRREPGGHLTTPGRPITIGDLSFSKLNPRRRNAPCRR